MNNTSLYLRVLLFAAWILGIIALAWYLQAVAVLLALIFTPGVVSAIQELAPLSSGEKECGCSCGCDSH